MLTMDSLKSRVAEAMVKAGLSGAELARKASRPGRPVSQQAVQQILSGRNSTSKHLPAIAVALGVSMDWLTIPEHTKSPAIKPKDGIRIREPETAKGSNAYNPDLWPRDLPVLGTAECGPDGVTVFNGEVIQMAPRPPNLAGALKGYAVYSHGESMNPRYFAGELVHINPAVPVQPGDFVLVQLKPDHEGEPPKAMLKRLVRRSASKIVLEQYNPPKTLDLKPSEVISIHCVVGSARG